MDAYEGVLISP